MFWLLQLLATGPCLARLHSFFPLFLSLCPCLSIIFLLDLSGLILFLCLHLSLLLLVCQMMYSRYGSSVTLVGPWRILKPSLSLSSFCFVFHKRTQNCLWIPCLFVAGDVTVFAVCSWDQTVALLNNPLTQPSIFTFLSFSSLPQPPPPLILRLSSSSAGLQYQSSFRKQLSPYCSLCHDDKQLFTKRGSKEKVWPTLV